VQVPIASKDNIDETLPTIYQPKHPTKGKSKEQNGRTHIQEDK
jgi:hypothetical protein